jgi:hypothetical protein
MMYASLEQAGAQHSLSPGNAWGAGAVIVYLCAYTISNAS